MYKIVPLTHEYIYKYIMCQCFQSYHMWSQNLHCLEDPVRPILKVLPVSAFLVNCKYKNKTQNV